MKIKKFQGSKTGDEDFMSPALTYCYKNSYYWIHTKLKSR